MQPLIRRPSVAAYAYADNRPTILVEPSGWGAVWSEASSHQGCTGRLCVVVGTWNEVGSTLGAYASGDPNCWAALGGWIGVTASVAAGGATARAVATSKSAPGLLAEISHPIHVGLAGYGKGNSWDGRFRGFRIRPIEGMSMTPKPPRRVPTQGGNDVQHLLSAVWLVLAAGLFVAGVSYVSGVAGDSRLLGFALVLAGLALAISTGLAAVLDKKRDRKSDEGAVPRRSRLLYPLMVAAIGFVFGVLVDGAVVGALVGVAVLIVALASIQPMQGWETETKAVIRACDCHRRLSRGISSAFRAARAYDDAAMYGTASVVGGAILSEALPCL